MSLQRFKKDFVTLGKMGRKFPIEVNSDDQLDMEKGGLWRLEGTEQAKISKDFVIKKMKEVGLEVRIDKVGNIFGRKEGINSDKKAILFGSHLDSVKNGGQFDGALGIMVGLEAIRLIRDEGFKNERSLELVVFMGEEGTSFKPGVLGSSVMIGRMTADEVLAIKNAEDITVKEVLEKTGHIGNFEFDMDKVEYFIELHVEQGPVLDKEKIPIGIVENIIAGTGFWVEIKGEQNHAGTTPMDLRRDALVAASRVVLFVSEHASKMAEKQRGSTVATVGKLEVYPSVSNVIPGKVKFYVEIRDFIESNIRLLKEEIMNYIKYIENKYDLKTSVDIVSITEPCHCSQEVLKVIEGVTQDLGIKAKRMNSAAGHDAKNIAKKVKTAMIFLPSVKGVSHSPMEWTNWEDVEKGIKVMTETLKRLSLR